MYIPIPETRQELLFRLQRRCIATSAGKRANVQLPDATIQLTHHPSNEDLYWLKNQRMPGRYAGCRIEYDRPMKKLAAVVDLIANPI